MAAWGVHKSGLWCHGSLSNFPTEAPEHVFEMLLESAPDCMLVINSEGRIVFANSEAETVFKGSREQLLGIEIEELIPEQIRDLHRMHRQEYMAHPHRRPMGLGLELSGYTLDSTLIPVEISLSPLQLGDEFLVMAAVRDTTHKKEVEVQLKDQQEKLLQSERLAAVGQMVLGLAHESRNALQRAQANLSMLTHRIKTTEETRRLLNGIQHAQGDLRRYFEQLRAYATPLPVRKSHCSLTALVKEVWAEFATTNTCNVLHVHIGNENDFCFVDRSAFSQVIRNILENSLQCGTEASVVIDVYLEAFVQAGVKYARITFKDNGPGISDHQRLHMFEPFYTTKDKGMGLGLAICQRIVEDHGGTIRTGDNLQGAELVIDIPAADPM